MHDTSQSVDTDFKPKGILKKSSDFPDKATHLRWDEDNLRITEAQKDAKMKVDEPKTPYIRYNPDLDEEDIDEMEDLKLAPDASSSIPSSTASSPKRAHIVAPADWASSEDDEEGETEADKEKHERFRRMRQKHYHLEGKYVHGDTDDIVDSDKSGDSDQDADAMSSDDSNDDAAANSQIRRDSRAGSSNGSALLSTPDRHVTRGFVDTYCAEDGNQHGNGVTENGGSSSHV
ncbi:hypothetical protein EV175_001756 [Coemansia sp. RSA 1933]|nr:hypothetical protein EV175_001756 [Coemansia sp. RSA 1933]